ncbi:MAG: DUF302 domain-containing protein [Candidatus Thorarchaeota archaeon]
MFKEKLGVEYLKYTMILACAPPLAKMALYVSKDTGTLFPCSFMCMRTMTRCMWHIHRL